MSSEVPALEPRPAPVRERRRSCRALTLMGGLLIAASGCEQGPDRVAVADPGASVASAAPETSVAARLGGEPIGMSEVDAQVLESDVEVMQNLFEARRRAVEQLVEERLLEQEASERGVATEALVAEEITAKIPEVTDEDIKAFYEQNKQAAGDQTLEQLTPGIRSFLSRRNTEQRRRAYLGALKDEAGFEMLLEPPRRSVTVASDEPSKGSGDAPVTIVEYSDFQCPFCARVIPTIDQVLDTYGENVRVVYRDYPLNNIHPQAQLAAEAAQCAHAQDKFWDYHDKLFENQKALEPDALKKYASELELDTGAFEACLDERRFQNQVVQETRGGGALGVSGTPAFFINGRFVSGALPFQSFKEIIDDELERAGLDVPER